MTSRFDDQPGLFEMAMRQVDDRCDGPPYYYCLVTEAEVAELAADRVPESLRQYARECLLSLAEWVVRHE